MLLDDTAIKDLSVFLAGLQARSDKEMTTEYHRFEDAITMWSNCYGEHKPQTIEEV